MKRIFVFVFLMIFVSVFSFTQQNVSSQQKFALVIGNGEYTDLSRLNNPVNDANDMEAALRDLGFTVDKVLNGNLEQMENAIMRLKNRLSVSKDTYGFFFYAGHGVQSSGVNYLIPVGARIPSENALRERAVSVQFMLNEINDAGNDLNIIVLDACRDNPFSWARSGSRGLTVMSNQPADSIIVYATSAGSVAADGTGRNGLFTSHLLTHLKTPDLDVKEIFDRTGAAVSQASNRQQIPAIYSQYFGRAFLGSQSAAPTMPAAGIVQSVSAAVQSAPDQPPAQTQTTGTTVPIPVIRHLTPTEMVRINGGAFQMGSTVFESGRKKDEGPRQRVTLSSFYIGKYEVTQKEYQEVMGANPSHFVGDNLPVESVSWFDAVEYCNRRSQQEGLAPVYTVNGTNVAWNWNANGYRLPTEAEWEYACRAGTLTAYNTGGSIRDNTGWYYSNSNNRTNPAGQKLANAWGLHDMHGNVMEWCWDWYGSYSSSAQTDPAGAVSGTRRVIRGGSWNNSAVDIRSALRNFDFPHNGNIRYGFRIVRNG